MKKKASPNPATGKSQQKPGSNPTTKSTAVIPPATPATKAARANSGSGLQHEGTVPSYEDENRNG